MQYACLYWCWMRAPKHIDNLINDMCNQCRICRRHFTHNLSKLVPLIRVESTEMPFPDKPLTTPKFVWGGVSVCERVCALRQHSSD